jgi:hypothetical protein
MRLPPNHPIFVKIEFSMINQLLPPLWNQTAQKHSTETAGLLGPCLNPHLQVKKTSFLQPVSKTLHHFLFHRLHLWLCHAALKTKGYT